MTDAELAASMAAIQAHGEAIRGRTDGRDTGILVSARAHYGGRTGDAGQPIDPREEARLTAVEARLNALLSQLPDSDGAGMPPVYEPWPRMLADFVVVGRATQRELYLRRGYTCLIHQARGTEQPDAAVGPAEQGPAAPN